MIIRQERLEDYDVVYHVVKEAFENAEYTDGNEQNLVVALRKSKSFIPELSLVAVEDEKIVGHILFTKAVVQGVEVFALAPLSVLPDYQNRGIGLSLMKERHSIAHKLGYEYAVVLGHPKYYPKAGYIPASEYGIKAPFEVDDESFMALNLNGNQKKLNGVIEYDKAFGIWCKLGLNSLNSQDSHDDENFSMLLTVHKLYILKFNVNKKKVLK